MAHRFIVLAAWALAGCTGGVQDPAEAHEDHGHDAVLEIDVGSDGLADVHEAPQAFVRIGFTYRAAPGTLLEVSTSPDGTAWSDWKPAVLAADADDPTTNVRVADHDAEEEARFFRVRTIAGGAADHVHAAFLNADDLETALESEDDLIGPTRIEGDAPEIAGTVLAHGSFQIYRFDQGRVTRPWLWLLRRARSRGWDGSLYGPRTGLRTYRQQLALWNAYQNGVGAPAFPPWGPSRHLIRNVRRHGKWYQAVDTNDVGELIAIARNLGVSLHTPYGNEPWHVEARRPFTAPRGWNP